MNGRDAWRRHAACRGRRTEIFFIDETLPTMRPERNGAITQVLRRAVIDPAAVRLCASCPVAAQCLDYALRHNVDGVWAGTVPDERRQLRKLSGITAVDINLPDPEPVLDAPEENIA